MTVCRIVKEPEDLAAMTKVLRSSKAINNVLRRVPQLGFAVRAIFGTSADLTKGDVVKGVIAHARLIEERSTATVAALSTLSEKPIGKVFDVGEDGLVSVVLKSGKTKMVGLNDIIENPKAYKLSSDQVSSIRHRLDLKRDFVDYYNRFSTNKLTRTESLFPRRVAGLVDDKGKFHATYGDEKALRPPSRKLKETGRFSTARAENKAGKILTQTEMIKDGYRYLDPDETLQQWAQEISKSTADAQFIRWTEKNLGKRLGILKTKKQIVGKDVKTGVFPIQPAELFGGREGDKIRIAKFDDAKVPGLGKYWAPEELVSYYTDILERPPRFEVPFLTKLGDEARVAIASFDASVVGIQLLVGGLGADLGHLLVAGVTRDPKRVTAIFPKAVYGAIAAMFDKGMPDRYFTENLDFINKWAPYLGGLRSSDYFDVLQRAGQGPSDKLHLLHKAQQPFARGFEFALDLAKIEQLKAWERLMKASGTKITPDMQEAMGAWARNSVGATSIKGLAMSPTQTGIEGTFLWFSQRYTRSLFATVGTIFELGVAGHEARLALGGLVTGGLLVYMAAAETLDQKVNLDPSKPGFMSIRVGNTWVGIGGGYRALTRLMINSFETTRTDPLAFVKPDWDNPLFAFWRSRTTPITSGVMDIWSGTDFAGRPIEGVMDWKRFVQQRSLTFNIQAALDSKGSLFNKVGIGIIATFGAGTNPMTERQQYDWYLKSIENADNTSRFPDGIETVHTDTNQFKTFTKNDPMARELKGEYEESRLRRGKTGREIQKALDLRADRMEAAEEQLSISGDYRQYRAHVNTIRGETRSTMEYMSLEFTPQTDDKKLVSSWYSTYDDPRAIDPITGGIDSEGLEQVQNEWKQANEGVYERLIEPSESIGESDMESELRRERKVISDAGWWDTGDIVWQQMVEITNRTGSRMRLGDYKNYADYLIKKRRELEQQLIDKGLDPPPPLFLYVFGHRY